MKRTILAVMACSCIAQNGASATDWALRSTLSETVELNSNPFLSATPQGTLSSYSTLNADATALTPSSRFTFDGDESYRKYWGPGVDGQTSESIYGDAKAHYEMLGKNGTDRTYFDGSFTSQSTAFALLGQLGVVTNTKGYVQTSNFSGGIDRSITALDFVSLQGGSTYTFYDPSGGGLPFTDSNINSSWRHRLNSTLVLTASSNAEELDFFNAQSSRARILRENAGFEAGFSPLLSFKGSWGAAFVQSQGGIADLSSSGSSPSSGSAIGFLTDMLLTYKLFPDTTLTLSGSQSISPTIVGSLSELSTVRAGLAYNVNSRTTLSFATDASRQTSAGIQTDFASASAVYGYSLTREWTAQLSYRYLHRFAGSNSSGVTTDPVSGFPISNGSSPANSSSIMLVVSRSFSLLPNGY